MDSIEYLLASFREFKKESEDHREKVNSKLQEILLQTTKTNGRVLMLEENVKKNTGSIEDHRKLNDYNKGRDRVIFWIIGVIGVAVGFIVSNWIKNHFII